MPTELREMLHDAVQDPPYDGTDPGELLTAGRRRVRARRTAIAVAAGTAAVVVAAIVGLAPRLGHFDPGPVGPVQPVGKVVHLSAAVDAVRGRDYRVLVRSDSGNLDRANGISLGPVADDGAVFVQDGPHGMHNVTRFGTPRPPGGPRAGLTPPPATAPASLPSVGIDRDRVLSLRPRRAARARGRDAVEHARRLGRPGRGSTSSVALPRRFTLQLGAGPHSSDGKGARRTGRWSAPLSRRRSEGETAGRTVTPTAGRGPTMAVRGRPTSEVHIRDLATGEARTFDSRSGRHCNRWVSSGSARRRAVAVLRRAPRGARRQAPGGDRDRRPGRHDPGRRPRGHRDVPSVRVGDVDERSGAGHLCLRPPRRPVAAGVRRLVALRVAGRRGGRPADVVHPQPGRSRCTQWVADFR